MRPRDLPSLRAELISAQEASAQALGADARRLLGALVTDDHIEELHRGVRVLRAAELFHVAPAMVDLAVAAADTVPEDAATADDLLPAEAGLLVWGVPLPDVRTERGDEVAPRGMWWLRRAGGVDVTWLVDPATHPDRLSPSWAGASLFPSAGSQLRPQSRSLAAASATMRTAVATWLLMGQQLLSERSTLDVRATGGAARRRRETDPVTIVDLRATYRPEVPREDDTNTARRRAQHRWIVRGHWRQQPHGPDRAERRPTWIASHVAGPDGAPWVARDKVMVWRR